MLYVNGIPTTEPPAPIEKPITKGNDEPWQKWFPIALKLVKNKKINCEIRENGKIIHKFSISPKSY